MSVVLGLFYGPQWSNAAYADSISCVLAQGGGLFGNGYGVVVDGKCVSVSGAGDAVTAGAALPIRIIDCGQDPTNKAGGSWNQGACGAQVVSCFVDQNGVRTPVDTFLVEQRNAAGQWVVLDFWCPGDPDPVPTTEALREAVVRLLPAVDIGTTHGTDLVNAETIFWAGTAVDRDLGTVTVVGRSVRLRIHLTAAHWDFGDGSSDTTTTPGTPYPNAGTCDTAECPAYYGHTYRATGTMRVTLTATWSADFSLDNGATWTPLATAPMPGPARTTDVQLKQARGVLVPDPH
ncbi:MAG: hypothetical protein ACTHMS_11790 [Jatrophihabitans sp.]|uniref:hypothetical protein n=1 Tax=Jatrophihabitans sp. TaxID=1932789 RepID=UPI003F8173B5